MARYDFTTPRLFVDHPLSAGGSVDLDGAQANYLRNVLRLGAGAAVLVFNGREGEWRAELQISGRRDARLAVVEKTRAQTARPDLHLCFAPLKQARLDYTVQKAVEMGAGRLQPVLTQHGQVTRLNLDRMRANAIEAAEQCGILDLAEIGEPVPLRSLLGEWDGARRLVFCDEGEEVSPLAALEALAPGPLAVLVGPEGGFSGEERALLRSLPFVSPIGLGPRILRADTAAVAALALVQASLGDWAKLSRLAAAAPQV